MVTTWFWERVSKLTFSSWSSTNPLILSLELDTICFRELTFWRKRKKPTWNDISRKLILVRMRPIIYWLLNDSTGMNQGGFLILFSNNTQHEYTLGKIDSIRQIKCIAADSHTPRQFKYFKPFLLHSSVILFIQLSIGYNWMKWGKIIDSSSSENRQLDVYRMALKSPVCQSCILLAVFLI